MPKGGAVAPALGFLQFACMRRSAQASRLCVQETADQLSALQMRLRLHTLPTNTINTVIADAPTFTHAAHQHTLNNTPK